MKILNTLFLVTAIAAFIEVNASGNQIYNQSLISSGQTEILPGPGPSGYRTIQSKPATIDASLYPTLQEALDAVPDSGGEVIIPPGEYKLTVPLVINRGDVHLKGSGSSTHLINLNQNGEPAIIVRPKNILNLQSGGTTGDIWRVQLSDFRVSGNEKSGDGLLLERVDEVYLSGLSVDHNGGNGINLTYCLENPRINQSSLTYNALAGIYIEGCHDAIVSACQFEENQDALKFIDGFNLTMSGNNIDDHLRHGIIIENTYACVISGNMIEECKGTAMILDRDCYGITVSANVFADNFGGGVELRDAWGCTVSANTFVWGAVFSVLVGPGSGRDVITGNNFCNTYIGDGKTALPAFTGKEKDLSRVDKGTGILLESTSDIAINGNVFGGLSGSAIKANGDCRRILVSGNMMTDLDRGATGAKIAMDMGNATECIVKDNAIGKGLLVK
jgi:hypothetical protein